MAAIRDQIFRNPLLRNSAAIRNRAGFRLDAGGFVAEVDFARHG
jgi:hypothetical protein